MSKTFLFILLIGAILFWWHWQNTPEPEQKKQLLWKTGIGALIVVTVLLVVTGKMHWLGAVFAGLLAYLRQGLALWLRYSPMLTQLYRTHAPSSRPPNTSTVRTRIIEMTLYHDSGKLSGKVLSGEFTGKLLDDLNRQQLASLRNYCSSNDQDSKKLLESYLVSRFGDESGSSSNERHRTAAVKSGEMTVSEAMQVLGLSGTPTKQQITLAYRKIMQQLHPDRGGNDYFAAKANQARDVLIEKVS